MDKNIVQGNWKKFKGTLKSIWGNISDNEWEETKGDVEKIVGLVQTKYGQTKDDVKRRVSSLLDKTNKDDDEDEADGKGEFERKDPVI